MENLIFPALPSYISLKPMGILTPKFPKKTILDFRKLFFKLIKLS